MISREALLAFLRQTPYAVQAENLRSNPSIALVFGLGSGGHRALEGVADELPPESRVAELARL